MKADQNIESTLKQMLIKRPQGFDLAKQKLKLIYKYIYLKSFFQKFKYWCVR